MTPQEQSERLVAIRAQLAQGQGSEAYESGRRELWGLTFECDAVTDDEPEALEVLDRFGLFAHAMRYGFVRTGDVVSFGGASRPREEVVVAWADYRRGRLGWFGWPQGEIAITRCRVETKASDEVHERAIARVLALPRSLSDELVRGVIRHHRPRLWRWIDDEVSRLQAAAAPTPEQARAKAALDRLWETPVHELVQARAIEIGGGR